jgi:CHAD domain-containing protein
MPAIEGYRTVLADLADKIDANWQSALVGTDPEALHDLRVAIRRTRSVLTQGKEVLPSTLLKEALDSFAWLGAQTGPARDFDVMLINWNEYTVSLPSEVLDSLEPFRLLIGDRRRQAYESLNVALSSQRAKNIMVTWKVWLHGPHDGSGGVRATEPVARVVARRIARVQDVIVDHGRSIHLDTPAEEVHDLRKDAKKLRYLLDCFSPLFPHAPVAELVARLKVLQENLGDHQDAVVHMNDFRVFAGEFHRQKTSLDSMLAIGQLIERLDQRRMVARKQFSKQFAFYDSQQTRKALRSVLRASKP